MIIWIFREPPTRISRTDTPGAARARVNGNALNPCLSGQPHRIKYLDDTPGYIRAQDGVGQTTADDIAEYYITNYYDGAVAHAQTLNQA